VILLGRKKSLSEDQKLLIAYLYENTDKSMGKIAKFLDLSKRSIHRYKNYKKQ